MISIYPVRGLSSYAKRLTGTDLWKEGPVWSPHEEPLQSSCNGKEIDQ